MPDGYTPARDEFLLGQDRRVNCWRCDAPTFPPHDEVHYVTQCIATVVLLLAGVGW